MRAPRFLRYLLALLTALLISHALLTRRSSARVSRHFSYAEHGDDLQQFPSKAQLSNRERAAALIQEFRSAWHGYSTHCFGHDEILPVTGRCSNSRNGWGASAIDALSTALVMRQKDIVQDILEYVPTINFKRNGGWPKQVSVFETTIRYLAGLLSAYDLLNSGLKHELGVAQIQMDALLTQAKIIADKLLIAFDTPSGLPVNQLWFEFNRHALNQKETTVAAAGTLILEFERLSDFTKDARYAHAAERATEYLLRSKLADGLIAPHTGLLPTWTSVETGEFTDEWGSWGAGRDSAYEYFLKAYIYDHRSFSANGDAWKAAANATITHAVAYHAARPHEALLMDWGGQRMLQQGDYLSAFAAGNFLLGGSVYNDSRYISFGIDLVNGIHALQSATKTGIGPEKHGWDVTEVPEAQIDFYKQHNWFIRDSRYQVRPEVLEAYYYAYRITGDSKYQDWAWGLLVNIVKACKTRWGFSSIDDVNSEEPKMLDFQESFLFSEVMKYAYLIFADGDDQWHVQKDGLNDFVFNTEGHPIKVRCKLPSN